MLRARRWRLAVVGLAGTTALVAGCSAPGSDSSTTHSAKPTSSISTDPAKAGKVTLRVWDQEVRGGQNTEISKLNKQFQARYPNVTIKRTAKSFSDLKTTLKLALSGNHPPDVVEANQGYPDMVSFVKAGMLTPLDGYSSVYGWTKRYPKTLLDLNRVSSDNKHFGTGTLYGISQMGEYIGVYYNKSVLAKAGVKVPKTWGQFTAALPKLKAAGQLPIQFGNLDKYPAIHTFGLVQDQMADKKTLRNLVYGTGNASWKGKTTIRAASVLRDWAKKGYLTKGANGLGYDDAAKKFAAGSGAFLLTGTWEAADLTGPMGDKLGLMPPPPVTAGGAPVTTGGESLAWAVTSKTEHPDVAAAYLNFLTNKHASDVMTRAGTLPAVPGKAADALPAGGVDAQMVDGWKKINASDGLVPYLDYSTPTFYDTLTAALQKLIGGKITPAEFAATLQADYAKFHH